MSESIYFNSRSYHLMKWSELEEGLEPEQFRHWQDAQQLISDCLSDSMAMGTLRNVLSKHGGLGHPLWDMDNHEVIEAVARLLGANSLYLVAQRPFDYDGAFLLPAIEKEEEPEDEKKNEELDWIEIHLVDMDDQPITHEPMEILTPDGTSRKASTNAAGVLRLDNLDSGDCEIHFTKRDKESIKRP